MPNTGNSSLARRIGALEAKNPAGPDWDKLTAEELGHLLCLNYMRWLNGLDDDALAESNRLNTALGLPLSDLRGPIDAELPPENQESINRLAGDDPRFRQWATKKTWTDCFYTVKVTAKWVLAVEGADCFPPGVREKAGALLRRRCRCLRLQPDQIEWLMVTLKGFDLGVEGPWLRDHLQGGYG
jgi:hypothetical protein